MTGCGDSDPTPTPKPTPTPAPQDHHQDQTQKCVPVQTSSEGSELKGGKERERTGTGDGGAATRVGQDESTDAKSTDGERADGESTDDGEAGDIEVEDDRRWSRRLSSHSHRSVRCPHGGCCRTVAAAGFLAHFRYEHRSVARAHLSTHHALRFALDPRCLTTQHHLALCVAQVNISGNYEELEVYSPGERHENDKLRNEVNGESLPGGGDVAVCALFGRVVTPEGGAGLGLALWCACLYDPLDRPPIAYTLRATMDPDLGRPSQQRTYVYHGPADCVRGGQQGGLLLPPPADPAAAIALRLRFHRLVPRRHTTATGTQ